MRVLPMQFAHAINPSSSLQDPSLGKAQVQRDQIHALTFTRVEGMRSALPRRPHWRAMPAICSLAYIGSRDFSLKPYMPRLPTALSANLCTKRQISIKKGSERERAILDRGFHPAEYRAAARCQEVIDPAMQSQLEDGLTA